MYISSWSTPTFSIDDWWWWVHTLTSTSSLISWLSVVVNHGPPRPQQVLPLVHPCESHRGSLRYHWRSYVPMPSVPCLTKILFSHKWRCSYERGDVHRGSCSCSYSHLMLLQQKSRCGFHDLLENSPSLLYIPRSNEPLWYHQLLHLYLNCQTEILWIISLVLRLYSPFHF